MEYMDGIIIIIIKQVRNGSKCAFIKADNDAK